MNISDAANPYICGRYFPNVPWIPVLDDIAIRENYAYVLDYYHSIYIIDISNPITPSLINTYYPECSLLSVEIQDNRLYGGSYNPYGIEVIDISDPDTPLHLKTHLTGNYPRKMVFSGANLFYVWNREYTGAGVIDVVDLSDQSVTYMAVYVFKLIWTECILT